MGLRINTNGSSLLARHQLGVTDLRSQRNLQRMSTGLRINRSADDPTGMALSESLRAQIGAMRQVSDNSRSAGDLVTVAEAGLSQISDLLHGIREAIVFATNGTASPDQLAAEQDFVDSAVESIRRIARTTRFGEIPLLNGDAGFDITNVDTAGILEIRPVRIQFNPITDPTTFTVNVTTAATAAQLTPGAVAGGDVTIQIEGPDGSAVLTLASGTTALQTAAAIQELRDLTGVYASGTDILTESFGSSATLRMEVLSGSGTIGGLSAGQVLFDTGTDAAATFGGGSAAARGNTLLVDNSFFSGEIELQAGVTGAYTFDVLRSGLLFQLGGTTTEVDQERVGIPSMEPEFLGKSEVTIGGETEGGFLASLVTGEDNDLFTNTNNAFRILDLSVQDLNSARAALGAILANVIDPAGRSADVAVENLTAADSSLRDADFAFESAEFARNQVLFQSGVAVLGQANQIPQKVLRLLTE